MDNNKHLTLVQSHEMIRTEDTSQYPDLNQRIKSHKRTQQAIHNIATRSENQPFSLVSEHISKLSVGTKTTSTYDQTKDSRTRQDILDERKLRKAEQKVEKERTRIEHQIEQIRAPKGEKIKLINQQEAERIKKATDSINEPFNRGKSRRSRNTENTLANFLDSNLSASTSTRSTYYASAEHKTINKKVVETARPKGKTREVPRPKHRTQLKKNILESRKIRRENQNCDKGEAPDVDSHSIGGNEEIALDIQKECTARDEHDKLMAIFSRKYRPYCNNVITKELCDVTESLIRDIFRFQDRAYNSNQIKARAHKRFVVGFKETQRQLEIKKIKLLIVAPDLEPTSTEDFEDGLDGLVQKLKAKCDEDEVPYLFSIRRWKLGRIMLKKVPVSCIGIINYDGAEQHFQKLMEIVQKN